MSSTDTAPQSAPSKRSRQLGRASALLSGAAIAFSLMSHVATAATANGLLEGNPIVEGSANLSGTWVAPDGIQFSDGRLELGLAFSSFSDYAKLQFVDNGALAFEQISIAVSSSQSRSINGPGGLQSLSVLFHGPAIDVAGALDRWNSNPPSAFAFAFGGVGGNTATLGEPFTPTNSSGEVIPDALQFGITFETFDTPGLAGAAFAGFGSFADDLGMYAYEWPGFTEANALGLPFDLYIGANGALAGLDYEALAPAAVVPIPAPVWLLGGALFSLVTVRRINRDR